MRPGPGSRRAFPKRRSPLADALGGEDRPRSGCVWSVGSLGTTHSAIAVDTERKPILTARTTSLADPRLASVLHAEREVARRRALLASDPTNLEHVQGLAVTLYELTDAQLAVGEVWDARRSIEECIHHSQLVGQNRWSEGPHMRNLHVAFRMGGVVAAEMGDLQGALRHLEHALRIARMLPIVARQPANKGDLPMTLELRGEVLDALGDHASAVESFTEAANITAENILYRPEEQSFWREALHHILLKLRQAAAGLEGQAAEDAPRGDLAKARAAQDRARRAFEFISALDPAGRVPR